MMIMSTVKIRPVQLRVFWDCRQRRVIRLTDPGDLIFGSSDRADIQLPDPTVSALHFTLAMDSFGKTFVRDLNSRNGTRLNGCLVRGRAPLRSGDLLQVGYVTLIYLIEGELQDPWP